MGMQKFRTMDPEEHIGGSSKGVNKRVVWFLLFLVIALPVVVGVLVWHFSPSCTDENEISSVTDKNTGNDVTSIQPTTNNDAEPWKNLRLPKYFVPIHYDITLFPDIYDGRGWFYGNETVEINITQSTDYILIHFHYMNITKTTLKDLNTGNDIEIKQTFPYEENQFWVIETKQTISAGTRAALALQFDASLTKDNLGFYKSTYVNSITGETRNLASSKFEPVNARRAFPCFDEPNIKAEYTVHLVHQNGYRALSNMPEVETVPWPYDTSLQITNFQRSVKMSTYLICFVVCDFDYLEAKTSTNVTVRTFATPDRVNQTQFSLDVAVQSMELYQNLFNVPYPLPKQDLIAIPDFVSGAMEHWGLITFREVNMLFDPQEASSSNQQRVAVVVAHEVSHQWFGNIVTMDWWDDLWLNEGFASFMEYLGANKSEPQWQMMEQFVTEDVQPVMVTDAGVTSHPIIVDVTKPDEINEVFDSISYSKGASVIRMMESIMGQRKFFHGVEKYLKKYQWGNARTDDLWEQLGTAGDGLSVKDVMDTWTRQMGLPYIEIKYSVTESKVTATQKRFLADGSTDFDPSSSPYGYKWYVYLRYITESGTDGYKWIPKTEESVTFDIANNPEMNDTAWIKYNTGQTGFYRVNYPDRMWIRFANALENNPSVLPDVDKSGLINDAMNLARAGILPYDVALSLTKYLDKEDSHLPWESAYESFVYISDMFKYSEHFGILKKYIISITKPVLQRLGWDDTGTHLQKLMRTNLISLACGMGDPDCLNNATYKFRQWIDHQQSVPPNIRTLVYRYGMQNSGSVEDWDKMWGKYQTETVPQEKIKLLYGLAQTKEIWLLSRYLEYTKNQTMVRSQDFFTVLIYISTNSVGKAVVWDWVRQNWQYLVDRFTLFSRAFGRLVPRIIKDYNTQFKLGEVTQFFKEYPEAGAGARGRQQALESIQRNIQWMDKYQNIISQWMCKQTNGADAC